MNNAIKSISMVFILFISTQSKAQDGATSSKKWGFETELAQPFITNVGIIRLQVTRTLTNENSKNKGELILGAYLRPNVKHDIVEKISEYLFITGYRQYFWKGLHAEAKSNIGYAWATKNKYDGKDYNNFSWFWEANAGYKFDFAKKQKYNFYVIPQIGMIGSIKSNIGYRGGESDNFPQANVMLGINF